MRTQVDGLGVVVTPGGESVIACALAGAPVHLDLDATHLGTPVVKRSGGQRGAFISAILHFRSEMFSNSFWRIFEGKPLSDVWSIETVSNLV